MQTTKPDIETKADIEKVVTQFYEKVKTDAALGIFFGQVIPINWEKHLPRMTAFWENVLLFEGNYEGDPLAAHRQIHMQYSTSQAHFTKWLQLFDQTVDQLFEGSNACKMKKHALAIAQVMMLQLK